MDWLKRFGNSVSAAIYSGGDGFHIQKTVLSALSGAVAGFGVAGFWQADAVTGVIALALLPLVISVAMTLRMRSIVRIDHRTGVFNARHFDTRFHQLFHNARRHKKPVSLIVIDLDLLKIVNDTYGHLAGDAVLRNLGAIIREHVRERHIAGRLGGDEFAVILPGMVAGDAHIVAERLRRAIAAAEVYTTSSADVICVTASFGLAQLSSRHGHPEEWFHAADMALNRAKQSGRNRVEFASFSHVLPKPQHTQAVQPIEDNPGVEANGQTVVSEEEAVYAETAWQWIVRTRPSHGFVASSVRQPNYTSLFTSII